MMIPDSTRIKHQDKKTLFFKAIDYLSDLDGQEYTFAIGYPKNLNEVDISEDDSGVYRISNFELGQLRVDGSVLPTLNCDLPCMKLNVGPVFEYTCARDLDGFSGGPVFSLHPKHKAIEFRGIAVTAGRDHIRFIPASWVNLFLDDFIAR